MKIARNRLPAIALLALLAALASMPAFAQTPPNAPSWFDQAEVRRHFTFPGTEDTSSPWGSGYSASMTSHPVTGQSYNYDYMLTVENHPDPEKEKHVWLQYTWLESGSGGIADPINQNLHGSTGVWSPATVVEPDTDLGGGLHQRTVEWTIRPQPANEWFEWWTLGDWKVMDVSVATICVPVPEPSSILSLLASGVGMGVLVMRRGRFQLTGASQKR